MEMLPVKLDGDMIGDDSTSYVSLKRKQESSLTLISKKIVLCFSKRDPLDIVTKIRLLLGIFYHPEYLRMDKSIST